MKTSLFAFKSFNTDPHTQGKENTGDLFDTIQGDSVFWEVVASVIVRKKFI